MNNLMNFSSFNESKEELNHKQLSKELKDLKKKRDQLLVVRAKKEKDSDVIKFNDELEHAVQQAQQLFNDFTQKA